MNIRAKVLAVVALMGLASVAIGGIAVFVTLEYKHRMDRLENLADRAHFGERLNRYVTAVVMESRGIYASDTTEQAKPFAEGLMANLDRIDTVLAEWQPLLSAEGPGAFDAVVARAAEFRQFRTETARLGRDVDPAQANVQGNNEDNRANRRAFQAEIDAVVQNDVDMFHDVKAGMNTFQQSMLILLASAVVIGLGAGTGAALYVGTAKLSRPVGSLTRSMRELANGDLNAEVRYLDSKDEIGEMARTLQVFRDNARMVAALSEEEKIRARSVADRAGRMEAFQAEFDHAVAAALEGDFTKRLHVDPSEPDLARIAGNVNGLLDNIEGGLGEAGSVLSALARTDLTQRMNGTHRGAFLDLQTSINTVADTLSEVVTRLRQTSRAVKSATGEILAGANDLSERTTKQAATIEETSAAMEQLASTVSQNADRAHNASSTAQIVTRSAEEGGEVMNQASAAMDKITASSSKISSIIGLIDDIAFQTNLLALNASVEAARAGDAGKGFAVVAVEVRRLAQSAATASADIKSLIDTSAGEVGAGTRLVSEAAEKLSKVLEAVRENSAVLESIARESREQASAIEEVNVAVRQMDEMTQHNAALVEQTNAAIEQTEAQANELDRIVGVFHTTDEDELDRAMIQAQRKGAGTKEKSAKATYLTSGNAALSNDWSEF
jgi:methyl-accepting chemotaxis protein